MSLSARISRLEAIRHLAQLQDAAPVPAAPPARVVIYVGRDERGQFIPKDEASRAALASPGAVKFLIPDNGR